ncbi:uncharacterized protein EDB91DRAFT_1239333 [Suillus paluster]|uniref:uncharacterized protein n=1 Tax=Suillus paluster TaxID=48578 RepID=UPI001B881121|nr:uncharacterized protein EDB91DRAFT_1239333 [Suillus paluster]KAG1728600.1 hypothetical protein EDB91DRAFT_1239333 [Suillus paluster]
MHRASVKSSVLLLLILLLSIFLSMPKNVPHTQAPQRIFGAFQVPCGRAGCNCFFKTTARHTKHVLSAHPIISLPSPDPQINDPTSAVDADTFQGEAEPDHSTWPTDEELRTSASSPPPNVHAEFFGPGNSLYCNYHPSLDDHKDLHETIDSIPLGDVKWEGFSCTYTGEKPDSDYPPWMEVIHNMLANPAYSDEMDYQPYWEYSTNGDERQWQDFMSGDWAWDQADIIAGDPETIGSAFVPVILRSNKTTVSVVTCNNAYYPLYLSIENVHNNVCRARRDAVTIIGFLAMPKTTKEHAADPQFRKFRHQLFHSSLSKILETLRPGMTKPEVVKFGDGHFRCVIYGLGPYIADYEEQVLLTCIVSCWCARCCAPHPNLDTPALDRSHDYTEALFEVGTLGELWMEFGIVGDLVPFTNDFPCANIHQLIAPDILHQIIKGIFKDHLVEWVEKYLVLTHGCSEADCILDDIDHRIAAVTSFSGRGFKQWTGDDSKALMKVYLPTIEGHVPTDVIKTFCAFLEFCYLICRNTITESTLDEVRDALSRFHRYRKIFETTEVIFTFSLPRQHSLMHYIQLIRLFGAPNGLCLSITESKHIKAIKEPWSCGMLIGTCFLVELEALETKCARNVLALAAELYLPSLPDLICRFLFEQTHPNDNRDPSEIPIAGCPRYKGKILVFNSACLRFYAPSDLCGVGGMKVEHICACPLWRNEFPHNDCIFINTGSITEGIRGLEVARICAFFSFKYGGQVYPCAVIHWFDVIGNSPDVETGMWMVRPAHSANHAPLHSVIHVDTIYHAAHLIPIYGCHFIPLNINLHVSYDCFWAYYVNKYVDHHAFEIAS